jgi:hypothetical protein
LLVGQHFHREYANAHVAADRAYRGNSQPLTVPVAGIQSPEPLRRRVTIATRAIGMICLVSVGVALWSRRWPSIIGLIICCVILMMAHTTTAMRF